MAIPVAAAVVPMAAMKKRYGIAGEARPITPEPKPASALLAWWTMVMSVLWQRLKLKIN